MKHPTVAGLRTGSPTDPRCTARCTEKTYQASPDQLPSGLAHRDSRRVILCDSVVSEVAGQVYLRVARRDAHDS